MFMGKKPNVNKQDVKFVLRSFIGHPAMPCHTVSEFTGIPLGTVQGHIAVDGSLPNLSHTLLYCRLFGQSFSNTLLSLIGQGGAMELEPAVVCPFNHMAGDAELVAMQGRFLADGHYNHQERLVAAPVFESRGVEHLRFSHALRQNLLVAA
jgi:hypothetical protein